MRAQMIRYGLPGILAFPGILLSAMYFEGKVANDGALQVDISIMRWGLNMIGEDRLVGKVSRYHVLQEKDLMQKITLTFDVVDNKTNKLDTVRLDFDMWHYGFRAISYGYEAPFCVDFKRLAGANRMTLCNVQVNGASVGYKTYNITKDLMKSSFILPEPKAIPMNRGATENVKPRDAKPPPAKRLGENL